jgi:hypothetical protein
LPAKNALKIGGHQNPKTFLFASKENKSVLLDISITLAGNKYIET